MLSAKVEATDQYVPILSGLVPGTLEHASYVPRNRVVVGDGRTSGSSISGLETTACDAAYLRVRATLVDPS